MSSRIEYYGKSGQNLKYSVCKPDGTPKGAPLHPLPESQTPGYYTTISHIDREKGDKVVIYGPEGILWEGEILTWEGDFVTVDETAGKGEFSAEDQALASDQKKNEKPKLQPLTKKARLIYDKLNTLQPYVAMTLPEIQDWLYKEHKINLDEGTWRDIRKELIPYGLNNRPRVGYYIEKK